MFTMRCRISLLTVCAAAGGAAATDRVWINPAGGVYSTGANWQSGVRPGTGDTTLFDLAAAYPVSFTTDPVAAGLFIGRDTTTLLLAGHTWSLGTAGPTVATIGATTGQSAHLVITGGTLTETDVNLGDWVVGRDAGSTGRVDVGAGGVWGVYNTFLHIGRAGTGYLVISDGGRLTDAGMAQMAVLGAEAGGVGEAMVIGAGSLWFVRDLYVGMNGTGSLTVAQGGRVAAESLSSTSASTVTLAGAGSSIATELQLALDGPLAIQSGAGVDAGAFPAALGRVTLTGTGSAFTGDVAAGAFTVGTGASLTSPNFNGRATLSGAGAVINAPITTGVIDAGPGSGAVLSVVSGSVAVHGPGASASGDIDLLGPAAPAVLFLSDAAAGSFGTVMVEAGGTLALAGGATVSVTGDLELQPGAALDAAGAISAQNLYNAGTIRPGTTSTRGGLALRGAYTQHGSVAADAGALVLGIAGAAPGGYDRLTVSGHATLDGTLRVALDPAFDPPAGATFTLLTAASLSGAFATTDLPLLPAARRWQLSYTSTSVVLSVAGSGCRADMNGDGLVTVQDFLGYLQSFAAADPRADFTADGAITINDFLAYLGAYAAGC